MFFNQKIQNNKKNFRGAPPSKGSPRTPLRAGCFHCSSSSQPTDEAVDGWGSARTLEKEAVQGTKCCLS